MKAAFILVLVILAILGSMTVLSQRKAEALKASAEQVKSELQAERAKSTELAANRPEVSTEELTRLREGNSELIRLRGEVNALKRERDELLKKVSSLESGAARAQQQLKEEKERASLVAAQNADPAQAAEQERRNTLLGAQNGVLRRKILSGQPLTPQEEQSLAAIQQRVANLEKNPAEFAQYQATSVATTLGWNNDPRAQQLQELLTKVAQAANNRGVSFNAPGQTMDTWSDQQKALDNRATTAVKNMLTPEEVAAFEQAFPSVLSADPAAGRR